MNCNFCLTYDSSEKVSDEAVGRGVVRKSERGAACVRNEINVKIRSAPLPSAAAKGRLDGEVGVWGVFISPARGRPHVPVHGAGFPFSASYNILFQCGRSRLGLNPKHFSISMEAATCEPYAFCSACVTL